MKFYTDVFREIQAPAAHQGEGTDTDSGAYAGNTLYSAGNYAVNFQTNNHRSWHPVMGPTGRTTAIRNASAANWLAPWNTAVGTQTMYCTDCHGSNTAAGVSSQATDGPPEGPHGSANIFLLKGWWDQCTGTNTNVAGCLTSNLTVSPSSPANTAVRPLGNDTTQDLCFKCHSYTNYATATATTTSGFSNGGTNLHDLHAGTGGMSSYPGKMRCMWCHVAVPHGWKNKAFLVNLNDVGPEAICRQEDADDAAAGKKCTETVGLNNPMPYGTQVRNGGAPNPAAPHPASGGWGEVGYTNPPYYRNAILKIENFASSGNWNANNCGSVGSPGNGQNGGCMMGGWMTGTEGCQGGTP